ncbi:hypothetical protein MARU1_000365 [Malassezia arunalokei]|uniref:Uncharacterized protein n=1 Tax=Malassezia arunalokei TaxID=1514897 RepID=A0AAJ6CIS6_9BASI|nr:hypothetical protein MARU1_000365 [Malassezia arunalokei]
MVLLYAWITCLLTNLVLAYDSHGSMRKMSPTKTLVARDVPLSTLSPASIFIPSLPGDKDATAPTSIIYMGQGFISYTSVYALLTGEKGKGEGPKTNYMFQGPTEINVNKVMRTDAVGDVSTSGLFDVACSLPKSGGPSWECEYAYQNKSEKTVYSTVTTRTHPNTLITPVIGLLNQRRQSTASGPTGTPSFTGTNAAKSWSSAHTLSVACALIHMLGTVFCAIAIESI